jgi:CHAT domain-containing protein
MTDVGKQFFARGGTAFGVYRRTGDLDSLKASVTAFQNAVGNTDNSDLELAFRLSLLRISLQALYSETGVPADRDAAIEAGRRAAAASPAGHPDRAAMLSALGAALLARFEEGSGDGDDLDSAVSACEQAVSTPARDVRSHAGHLYGLGNALHARFLRGRAEADIDAAVAALRDAVAVTPASHPDRSMFLHTLAASLEDRFRRSGNGADIDGAVSALEESVDAAPHGHPEHAHALSALSNALRERFAQSRVRADIDASVEAAQRSVAVTLPEQPAYGGRLHNLQLALGARFVEYGGIADVEAAVDVGRRSVAATRLEDADRPDRLAALAYVLGFRFEHGGNRADLDAAIDAAREAAAASTSIAHELSDLLSGLAQAAQELDEELQQKRPGHEELYAVIHDVATGVITLDQACELADERAGAGAFELQVLADAAQEAVEHVGPDSLWAWQLGRVVAAAARGVRRAAAADRKRDSGFVLMIADFHLISEATALLSEVGDIRVFTTATEAAQEALVLAAELELSEEQGAILQRRAMMIITCYARGPGDQHAQAFQDWVAAGFNANPDPDLKLAVADIEEGPYRRQGLRWPESLEALATAESDLRAALLLVADRRRGPVLKALSDVLAWREMLGGPPAGTELIEVCQQALDALAPEQRLLRLAVSATLARAQRRATAGNELAVADEAHTGIRATDVEALAARLESDWDAIAERPLEAWDAATLASDAFEQTDPARALRLLSLQRQLPVQWANETRRIKHYARTLTLLARISAPARLWRILDAPPDSASVSEQILAAAADDHEELPDGLRPEQLGGALTLVLLAGERTDRDDIGLKALTLLREVDPELTSGYRDAYGYFEGQMLLGQGLNEERAGNYAAAVRNFLSAAAAAAAVEAGGEVIRAVTFVTDLVKNEQAPNLSEVTAWCSAYALRVELAAPQFGPEALQQLLRVLLARLVREQGSNEDLFLLLQAAKGRRMAAMLAAGTTGWVPDRELRHLLGREAEQVRNLPAGRPLLESLDGQTADTDVMVAAYISDYETSPSDTPGGALANLRRAIERKIAASIIPADHAPPAKLQDVLAALDNRTALLTLYEGQLEGKAATFGMLISHDVNHVAVAASEMPFFEEPIITTRPDGKVKVHIPAMGHILSGVRRAVQEEPAPRNITSEGKEQLADLAAWALSAVDNERANLLTAGIDRLVIVPHGAYHFAPLHLAGPAGKPVADDFIVTYLANLDQLIIGRSDNRGRREGAAVFALSYADQPQLPDLESSAAEGRLLGSVLGVQPVLDGDATKDAVIAALQRARWVHLSAHGMLDADAPMFQTVFLSPSEGHDGRLLAHEIATLDLRGLELVTLGACETSLGRVDISDNVRGLPAAFLTAGAKAVIGTLWQVTDASSTVFFTALYRSLALEAATIIEAFGAAQRVTREQCPEYRDWGAFYLTGGYDMREDVR